jgi:predicted HTH transcriptional regulator
MSYDIDLKALSQRESEQVEWKEHGDLPDITVSIVKTIVAFANDISNFGGGYVVCGAKEIKDEFGFPKVQYTGLTANKLKEIEGKITQHCRDYTHPAIVPVVQELENPYNPATRILVFIVVASTEVHLYRDGQSSNYYVRIARETREAGNGVLMQLLLKKQKLTYFDQRVNAAASEIDIDILLLRDCVQEMNLLIPEKSLLDYISDMAQISVFIPPLFAKINLDKVLRPKNFTVLLFGKDKSITRFHTNAYSVVSIYKGTDRSEPTAERYTFVGNIIGQAKKIIVLLATQTYTAFDKLSKKPNQVNYPMRALQEAVVNAIVHRDYELNDPIRITVFSDRIEVKSPGALHWGVDKAQFLQGKASAKWRNQSFADVFNRIQLAQSEGQGIPTIFRAMKEEGCPAPIFEFETESITCILPAHPRHLSIKTQQKAKRIVKK